MKSYLKHTIIISVVISIITVAGCSKKQAQSHISSERSSSSTSSKASSTTKKQTSRNKQSANSSSTKSAASESVVDEKQTSESTSSSEKVDYSGFESPEAMHDFLASLTTDDRGKFYESEGDVQYPEIPFAQISFSQMGLNIGFSKDPEQHYDLMLIDPAQTQINGRDLTVTVTKNMEDSDEESKRIGFPKQETYHFLSPDEFEYQGHKYHSKN